MTAKRYYKIEFEGTREGLRVERDARTDIITLSGWYDTFVGIQPLTMHTTEFLEKLGIQIKR